MLFVWHCSKDELSFRESAFRLVGKPFAEWEKTAIIETLKITSGRRDKAAEILQVPVRTLYRRLRKYSIKTTESIKRKNWKQPNTTQSTPPPAEPQ